jgi:hypothetical protein
MTQEHRPADPIIRQAARRLAWRNVATIESLLRDEEMPEAAREFQLAAVEEMEALRKALQRQWKRLRDRMKPGRGKNGGATA